MKFALLVLTCCLTSNASASLEDLVDAKAALVDPKTSPWWSALRDESFYKQCQSSCTEFSRGTTTKVELCDDTEVCRGRKETIDEFATKKCSDWKASGSVPEVEIKAEGKRFKQEPSKGSWISCAIFCRTGRNQWYSPRTELGRDAFFPDGTWCHRDNTAKVDYYCQKNLCLPQGYEFSLAVRLAEEALESDDFDGFIDEIEQQP